MTVAALVDLGVPFAEVQRALDALRLDEFAVELQSVYTGSIGATRFVVKPHSGLRERTYRQIDTLLVAASLDEPIRQLARAMFRRLAESESEVHRIPIDEVHFHEVGAVDAIVDIVGAAACFAYLGAEVSASNVPLGRGTVTCRHGVLPLPAPATVLCLRGVPTYDAGIEAELVTPTGAAILASVARSYGPWPALVPERVGWGAGTRELPDRPNALRVVLGRTPAEDHASLVVLEANVDDMSGELAAHAISRMLAQGALDAWATPIVMKKGRPALMFSALVRAGDSERLSALLMQETTSIGVRQVAAGRTERPRRAIWVETPFGEVRAKLSEGAYGPPQLKPEFDDCVRVAEAAGVPVKAVLNAAASAARDRLRG